MSGLDDALDSELMIQQKYNEFNTYLSHRTAQETTGHREEARKKLAKLTRDQFGELSTDVHDELTRRRDHPNVWFLAFRHDLHPKRNQARQKLATLPPNRFNDLASDVFFELCRRWVGLDKGTIDHLRIHLVEEFAELRHSVFLAFDHESGKFVVTKDLFNQDNAPMVIGMLQECLSGCKDTLSKSDTTIILRFLQDMCSVFEQFPLCYWTAGVTRRQRIASGAEASIFLADHNGMQVVVREPHFPGEHQWGSRRGRELLKDIRRELVAHWQMSHENILPLIGVYQETTYDAPSMVLPYMSHGSAQRFLQVYGDPGTFLHVVYGCTSGLAYLHSFTPPIIHGDIHDTNVLIDNWGNACICDFGFSRIRHEISRTLTVIRSGGRAQFISPEVSSGEIRRPTEASDVYSLAMTIYALGTDDTPFAGCSNERAATRAAENGERPDCPGTLAGLGAEHTAQLYALLEEMWAPDPAKRARAAYAERAMQALVLRQRDTLVYWSLPYPLTGPDPPLGGWRRDTSRALDSYSWEFVDSGVALIQTFAPQSRDIIIADMLLATIGNDSRVSHLQWLFARCREFSTEAIIGQSFATASLELLDRPSDPPPHVQLATLLIAAAISRHTVFEICARAYALVPDAAEAMLSEWDRMKLDEYDRQLEWPGVAFVSD